MTKKEAVEFYLPQKLKGQISLGDIRQELMDEGEFSEEVISEICTEISDLELSSINENKGLSLNFLDHVLFSYFMVLFSVVIFLYSYRNYLKLDELAEITEVEDIQLILPILFMIASVFYLFRHIMKIIKRSRKV